MGYKTELQNNNIDLQEILDAVNSLPEETKLPELSNPADAENIQSGYEAIDRNGEKIIGTYTPIFKTNNDYYSVLRGWDTFYYSHIATYIN